MVSFSIGQMQGKASERREIILRYIDRARRSLDAADADAKLNCGQKREHGGVAQLGEHLPCKQGVRSSILLVSTRFWTLKTEQKRRKQKRQSTEDEPWADDL